MQKNKIILPFSLCKLYVDYNTDGQISLQYEPCEALAKWLKKIELDVVIDIDIDFCITLQFKNLDDKKLFELTWMLNED